MGCIYEQGVVKRGKSSKSTSSKFTGLRMRRFLDIHWSGDKLWFSVSQAFMRYQSLSALFCFSEGESWDSPFHNLWFHFRLKSFHLPNRLPDRRGPPAWFCRWAELVAEISAWVPWQAAVLSTTVWALIDVILPSFPPFLSPSGKPCTVPQWALEVETLLGFLGSVLQCWGLNIHLGLFFPTEKLKACGGLLSVALCWPGEWCGRSVASLLTLLMQSPSVSVVQGLLQPHLWVLGLLTVKSYCG